MIPFVELRLFLFFHIYIYIFVQLFVVVRSIWWLCVRSFIIAINIARSIDVKHQIYANKHVYVRV